MQLRQLVILCEDGGLSDPMVSRAKEHDRGYYLHFRRRDGSRTYVTKHVGDSERRVFKSLDGAAQAAKYIGCSELKVDLDGVEDMKRPTLSKIKSPA